MNHGIDDSFEPRLLGNERDAAEDAAVEKRAACRLLIEHGCSRPYDLVGDWTLESSVVHQLLPGTGATVAASIPKNANVRFGEERLRFSCKEQAASDG
jgi:hypothetical protein